MFKSHFKCYKSKCRPPDTTAVINLHSHEAVTCGVILESPITVRKHNLFRGDTDIFGMKPVPEWELYEITSIPGLLYLRNPFTAQGQRYWVCRCLQDFTQKPHSKLNLDIHGDLDRDEDWWQVCQGSDDRSSLLCSKLRWATLGYHHNWDTKVYSEDFRDPFPADLAVLCQRVAQVAGFKDFSAQAAIINFYHMDSTLSGHIDHSEINQEAPLFSFSFGQSAIFLIGGPTIDDEPLALFLHSGDIAIMSGHSRLCYHGVPRIVPATSHPWNDDSMGNDGDKLSTTHCLKYFAEDIVSKSMDDSYWQPFGQYLATSRINMNVRQVLWPGHKCLPDSAVKWIAK